MASAAVQSKSALVFGANPTLSFDAPVALGGTIVVLVFGSAIASAVSDTINGSYSEECQAQEPTGSGWVSAWVALDVDAGEPVIQITGAYGFAAITIVELPPCSAVRDAAAAGIVSPPITVPLDVRVGDYVLAMAKSYNSTTVTGGTVGATAATLLPSTGLNDVRGFDVIAEATDATTPVTATPSADNFYAAIAALSLISNLPPPPPGIAEEVDVARNPAGEPPGIAEEVDVAFSLPSEPKVGVWTDISPIPFGGPDLPFTQGIAIAPSASRTVYVAIISFDDTGTDPNTGIWRSDNGGSSWRKISGASPGPNAGPSQPIIIVVNPTNPNRIYACDGVRGPTSGVWYTDNADAESPTWVRPPYPPGYNPDAYSIDVDPTDWDHIIVAHHNDWTPDYGGVLESYDRGATWIDRPNSFGGFGQAANFLFDPTIPLGNANTWLVANQSSGRWRTTDNGDSYVEVTPDSWMAHGGQQLARTASGTVYVSGAPGVERSNDNGATWTQVFSSGSSTCLAVACDDTHVYTQYSSGNARVQRALLTDDTVWEDVGTYDFPSGPGSLTGAFALATDTSLRRLYNAAQRGGVWVYQFAAEPTGEQPANPQFFAAVSG